MPKDVEYRLRSRLRHRGAPARRRYLRALAGRLAPKGTIVNIDFHAVDTPVGPPVDHRVSREAFLDAAKQAGLELLRKETFLPSQYFVVLAKRQ